MIPTGVSAAVVTDKNHGHYDHDWYKTAERVKDRIAALDTANAERTADLNQAAAERAAKLAKDICDVDSEAGKRALFLSNEKSERTASVIAAVTFQADATKEKICNSTASVLQAVFCVDKDVQLLAKDVQISEKNLALGAAQNQAATMLLFKESMLQLAGVEARFTEKLKSEVDSIKDTFKQSEIDSLRSQLLDAKARNRHRTFAPLPLGTLSTVDES